MSGQSYIVRELEFRLMMLVGAVDGGVCDYEMVDDGGVVGVRHIG